MKFDAKLELLQRSGMLGASPIKTNRVIDREEEDVAESLVIPAIFLEFVH